MIKILPRTIKKDEDQDGYDFNLVGTLNDDLKQPINLSIEIK